MELPLLHLALVGTPNSGKTSLFNALTGSRQKVANYPGVTVERKEGFFVTPLGRQVSVVDLPGTYSLRGRSPDEEITRDFVLGKATGEIVPDLVLCVADFDQSAPDHPPAAGAQAHRPADDPRAQHVRHRDPPRHHCRRRAARQGTRRARGHLDRGAQGRHGRPAVADRRDFGKARRRAGREQLAGAQRGRSARHPARSRPHHRRLRQPAEPARHLDRADRRDRAASRRRADRARG